MPQKKFDIDVSKIESSEVCKPGDLILAELERKNISQKELADAIGKSTPVVNDLIKGKRKITVPIACLLGAVFDSAPEEWLNIQNLYDIQESNADEDLRKRTQRIKNWNAFKDAINVRQLKKRLSLKCDLDGCIESTLLDTGTHSVDELYNFAESKIAYFKKSDKFQTSPANLLTWIVVVRHKSNEQQLVHRFNSNTKQELINKINSILYKNIRTEKRIKEILNEYGIKFIVEDKLEKMPVDGYSFWQGTNPTVAMTKRYKRLDNFAFTLMHELGHIFLHLINDRNNDYIDDTKPDEEGSKEKEANSFATKCLSKGVDLDNLFAKWKNPYAAKNFLKAISNELEINSSIVAGQYQHYCKIYSVCRDLITDIK